MSRVGAWRREPFSERGGDVLVAIEAGSTWVPPGGRNDVVLTYGAASHPGVVRVVNEDGWLTSPPVFLVADGMGGHRAGDVASAIVVRAFDDMVRRGPVDVASVERCIAACQVEIEALSDGAGSAPGSTLVAAVHVEEDGTSYWLVLNIGDSRAYSWTSGRLEQISRDHSRVQELIDAGELEPARAHDHPERHVITRAIGPIAGALVDYSLIPLADGATLLLCSDGVTSELDDSALARLLARGTEARDTAESIVAAAVEAGGRDNATAVVVVAAGTGVVVDTLADVSPAGDGANTIPGRGAAK